MKIDPYYQRQKCRPLTLVSGDIMFVRIFAGVLWRGGVKRQWDDRKHRFSEIFGRYVFGTRGNEAKIIMWYYLVPCRLSSDPKMYALNDLDWLFRAKICFRAGLAASRRATSESNCVKTNKDRHILSATKM